MVLVDLWLFDLVGLFGLWCCLFVYLLFLVIVCVDDCLV